MQLSFASETLHLQYRVGAVMQYTIFSSLRFEKPMYEGNIPENASPGTPILKVRAIDPDAAEYGAVKYQVTESKYQKIFRVSQDGK